MNTTCQTGILQAVPPASRYMLWDVAGDATAVRAALAKLAGLADGIHIIAMAGEPLAQRLGVQVPGLKSFPTIRGPRGELPRTPHALCLWLRGAEQGDLLKSAASAHVALRPAFACTEVIDCFRHGYDSQQQARDLIDFVDGTENPKDDDAVHAAIASGMGPGLDGGSYFALQLWLHDMAAFDSMSQSQKDDMIGRRQSDNEELEDAPESAHVKRTAQEDFDPEAYILRRNMPWWRVQADGTDAQGTVFAGFGCSFYAFEVQMRRMSGKEDGIADGLFQMSSPTENSYYWCPPMLGGKLDWRALGL